MSTFKMRQRIGSQVPSIKWLRFGVGALDGRERNPHPWNYMKYQSLIQDIWCTNNSKRETTYEVPLGSERDKTKAKPKPQTKPNNNTTRMHLEGEIRPPGCPDISKHNIAKSAFFIVSGQSPEDHAPSLLFLLRSGSLSLWSHLLLCPPLASLHIHPRGLLSALNT